MANDTRFSQQPGSDSHALPASSSTPSNATPQSAAASSSAAQPQPGKGFDRVKPLLRVLEGSIDEARRRRLGDGSASSTPSSGSRPGSGAPHGGSTGAAPAHGQRPEGMAAPAGTRNGNLSMTPSAPSPLDQPIGGGAGVAPAARAAMPNPAPATPARPVTGSAGPVGLKARPLARPGGFNNLRPTGS